MVGTNEQVLEMRKKRDPEELSDFAKDIIGGTCRIEIPFRDKFKLRKAADLLRGYADTIENFTRRTDLPDRAILFYLREEARRINYLIKDARGPGRPKKDYDADQ
jgi:hypothetical protein